MQSDSKEDVKDSEQEQKDSEQEVRDSEEITMGKGVSETGVVRGQPERLKLGSRDENPQPYIPEGWSVYHKFPYCHSE